MNVDYRTWNEFDFDRFFYDLGARFVYDEPYARQSRYHDDPRPCGLFARYFFLDNEREIGYYIPELIQFGSEPHIHSKPRVWGLPRMLVKIKEPICG